MENPKDEDEERRKKEINMFAAFALGGEEPISGFDTEAYNLSRDEPADASPHSPNPSTMAHDSTSLPVVIPPPTSPNSIVRSLRQRGSGGTDFSQVMKNDDNSIWNETTTVPRKMQRRPKNWDETSRRNTNNEDFDHDSVKAPTSSKVGDAMAASMSTDNGSPWGIKSPKSLSSIAFQAVPKARLLRGVDTGDNGIYSPRSLSNSPIAAVPLAPGSPGGRFGKSCLPPTIAANHSGTSYNDSQYDSSRRSKTIASSIQSRINVFSSAERVSSPTSPRGAGSAVISQPSRFASDMINSSIGEENLRGLVIDSNASATESYSRLAQKSRVHETNQSDILETTTADKKSISSLLYSPGATPSTFKTTINSVSSNELAMLPNLATPTRISKSNDKLPPSPRTPSRQMLISETDEVISHVEPSKFENLANLSHDETEIMMLLASSVSAEDGTDTDESRDIFSRAANAEGVDSGTFAFDKTASTQKTNTTEQANFDAAVAAFEKTEIRTQIDSNNKAESSSKSRRSSRPGALYPIPLVRHEQTMRKTDEISMFTEEVLMPRPLFFGAVIPPRVLEEAKCMVKVALAQYDNELQHLDLYPSHTSSPTERKNQESTTRPSPRLHELPVEVRNVIGAFRTYGYGLVTNVVKDLESKSTNTLANLSVGSADDGQMVEEHKYRGNSHVSTFQPVFENLIRVERMKCFRKQLRKQKQNMRRPRQLSLNDRSSTAPARLLPLMLQQEDDNFDDFDDDDSISDRLSSQMLELYSPLDKVNPSLMDVNKTDDGRMAKNPEKGLPLSSKPLTEALSPNELFSMWLRNDDDSYNGTISNESHSSHRSKGVTLVASSPLTSFVKPTVPLSVKTSLVSPTGTVVSSNTNEVIESEAHVASTKNETKQGDVEPANPSLNEQELFSRFARGEKSTWTNSLDGNSLDSFTRNIRSRENEDVVQFKEGLNATGSVKFMNTFRLRPAGNLDGDDDGSVIDDEQRKQVGINDHFSKAIALLEDDGQQLDNTTLEESQILLSANDGNRLRPLTNYELSTGCVPLFGTDDAPLPLESDLGIHDSKEEQQRAICKKRSQEIIDKFVAPNVFGPIACPNPAIGPDDSHSWMSRSVSSTSGMRTSAPSTTVEIPSGGDAGQRRQFNSYGSNPSAFDPFNTPPMQKEFARTRSEGNSIDAPLNLPSSNPRGQPQGQQQYTTAIRQLLRPPKHSNKRPGDTGLSPSSVGPKNGKRLQVQTRSRYGWWSPMDESLVDDDDGVATMGDENGEDNILQIPPIQHSSSGIQVMTVLDPSPEKLRTDNLPLSRMHAATAMEQCLPYLSDRPHSHRYLQIDTQAIAFPPLKGEIEPLFCSLAIYNVEAMLIIGNTQIGGERAQSNATSSKVKAAPLPNWQRCGRVTEALYFDYVADDDVAQRCAGALFPNQKVTTVFETDFYSPADATDRNVREILNENFHSTTRCGVFPIPSNLNVANLYAVLVVRKVISEESDLDPYVKSSFAAKSIDMEKLRANASKNSDQHGCFLMPFAFGVAPLMQVFGTDNPFVPSSRAVQIPLFRFIDKESQIIDHIMVMLFPKANHKANGVGGPAPVTNGGTAMLVMRNFGYLGLHQVIDSKSSLARDRLVDCTGEIQVRRKSESEKEMPCFAEPRQEEGYRIVCPDFHNDYIAEPTVCGGRVPSRESTTIVEQPSSKSYAQELFPLPLLITPSIQVSTSSIGGISRGATSQDDIEKNCQPFYNTTFCNELLCHPRILHNCLKGNVVLKVELREVEWVESINCHVAHLPTSGPSIHNSRRGSYLVQSSFSSCTSRRSHQFMDEFKIKLPLDLKPKNRNGGTRILSLFFTAYKIKLGSKGIWKRGAKLFFGSGAETESDKNEEHGVSGDTRLKQVACGFLPITDRSCLIDNGVHDVRAVYKSSALTEDMIAGGYGLHSSYLLKGIDDNTICIQPGKEDSCAEDTTVSDSSFLDSSFLSDKVGNTDESVSVSEDPQLMHASGNLVEADLMSLSVRIVVYSSVHSQNATLSDFLNQESDIPLLSQLPNKVFMSTLRMGRDFLVNNTGLDSSHNKFHSLDERLVESTIAITDNQLCSVSRSAGFTLRIMDRLWRSLICGNGEPNLAWANPGTVMPLRTHSFATIVHIVGATALYLAKNGVTQLDGTRKWNVVTFGRVLALLFNEENLFGNQAIEKFDEAYWSTPESLNPSPEKKKSPKKPPQKKRRHVRNNYDLFSDMPPREAPKTAPNELVSSTAGDLATPPQKRQILAMEILSLSHSTINSASEIEQSLDSTSNRQEIFRAAKEFTDGERKVDSKLDFQHAFRAANAMADGDFLTAEPKNSSNIAISAVKESSAGQSSRHSGNSNKAFLQAFGDAAGSSRRWMTAPTKILLTIPESENDEDGDNDINVLEQDSLSQSFGDMGLMPSNLSVSVDSDCPNIIVDGAKQTKQMRRPRRPLTSTEGALPIHQDANVEAASPLLLTSDDDIETKGTAFLDSIGNSIGLSYTLSNINGEEQRVGSSHHRSKKNHNRSSIDWSLMSDSLSAITQPPIVEESLGVEEVDQEEEDDETMSLLKKELASYVRLPCFIDRLLLIGKSASDDSRWFPFGYEVIIMQWAAILMEQRKAGNKTAPDRSAPVFSHTAEHLTNRDLGQAALRSVGVAVASAPMLFEVVKQSLGFRVQSLFKVLSKKNKCTTPPLAMLDETLTLNLEHVITMVTDACIDSRNFDSWDLRQMSIDVNDALVRFLRDLFSFLVPSCVHRLILAYFARYVTRDGKQVSDRDSKIGLRCSWEITKLRLNAVTALIRFPEFLKINSPQMLNWANWWMNSPTRNTSKFFDNVLDRYQGLRHQEFVGSDDAKSKFLDIPSLKPHWLAEIVVDVCLLGTEHAEQYIQHRSASLLHELFWSCSQESILAGTSAPVASMFVSFIEKVVANVNYLANFSAKSQMRKDILLCVIFVLQSVPKNLLRALWRQLIARMPGRNLERKYCGDLAPTDFSVDNQESQSKLPSELKEEPNILGMFSLLNLALRTIEYEGCDDFVETDGAGESRDTLEGWHREYLLCKKKTQKDTRKLDDDNAESQEFTSSVSRKWQAHDGSIVIVNSGHHIVRELYGILRFLPHGKQFLNPAVTHGRPSDENATAEASTKAKAFSITRGETILFVRATTSLYLHALALRQSDIVLVRTFLFTAEVIKMFGISIFLEAVGETLQHWMRMISFNCGARRAQVRIEATDLLELILRSSWECFGSFFRIRVPLLAVQTEVMERIVALAASRYYREQRKTQATVEAFSNLGAEASLVPLWRTLDRIQKQPASQNIAFRGALVRIAGKLKKLYRAYVAARVLSFIKGAKDKDPVPYEEDEKRDYEAETKVRANRINLMRVINASAGHSKQFLGFQGTSSQISSIAHFEAVEDALIDAADVFSPTELPEHRVAWLRMLAEFHSGRKKYAEEGTCHYHIHVTLHLAAKLHGSLWSNTPFLPWTDNIPDPVIYYVDENATQTDPDCTSDLFYDNNEWEYGRRMDNANSFRRIFYRVANSIAIENNEWETGISKNLFYGITYPDEYSNVSPWITLRDMEENMAEEVEAAGHLFLKAGVIESSRFAWNVASQFYAEKYNYAKLATAYSNLSKAVVSQVPPIDTSLPHEILATLGRFYRVWFHGGAPDDLSGVEFVYRSQGDIFLKQFGDELRDVIKSIVPDKTPIHLVLDGLNEEKIDDGNAGYTGFSRIGPAPLEPVRIKVTPLTPIFESKMRGLPQWFSEYVDEIFSGINQGTNPHVSHRPGRGRNDTAQRIGNDPHHHFRSFSATIFSSAGSATTALTGRRGPLPSLGNPDRGSRVSLANESNLRGVDKFCFLQPRDRTKIYKDWWKTGDFAEKCLKITQLQVSQFFPACVTRQAVVHRLVYTLSPLEAGIDAVCQWCAVLFRTSVSTAGTVVLKMNFEPGIGSDASKVVSDCIHGSRIKEIALAILKESDLLEGEQSTEFTIEYDRLSDDEVKKIQRKFSRLLITYIELLHLLIARNRDLLLNVIKNRKKSPEHGTSVAPSGGASTTRNVNRAASSIALRADTIQRNSSSHYHFNSDGNQSDSGLRLDPKSLNNIIPTTNNIALQDDQQSFQSAFTAAGVKTDSAIAVQSELQRSFIKLVKDLYPRVHGILQSETPRWIKQCTYDNYFSQGTYQQTKVQIAEELCFISVVDDDNDGQSDSNHSRQQSDSHLSQSDNGYASPRGSIGGVSQSSAAFDGFD